MRVVRDLKHSGAGHVLTPYGIGRWGTRDYSLRRVWRTDLVGSKSVLGYFRPLIFDKDTFSVEGTHDEPTDEMAYSPAGPEPSWW